MCQKISCKNCGKATWRGCGQHIEQALDGVPENERCKVYKTRFGVCTDGSGGTAASDGATGTGANCNVN